MFGDALDGLLRPGSTEAPGELLDILKQALHVVGVAQENRVELRERRGRQRSAWQRSTARRADPKRAPGPLITPVAMRAPVNAAEADTVGPWPGPGSTMGKTRALCRRGAIRKCLCTSPATRIPAEQASVAVSMTKTRAVMGRGSKWGNGAASRQQSEVRGSQGGTGVYMAFFRPAVYVTVAKLCTKRPPPTRALWQGSHRLRVHGARCAVRDASAPAWSSADRGPMRETGG